MAEQSDFMVGKGERVEGNGLTYVDGMRRSKGEIESVRGRSVDSDSDFKI